MTLNHLRGRGILSEFTCEITDELDKAAGIGRVENSYRSYHFIILDRIGIHDRVLPIRIHGGTVGFIGFDSNKVITKIEIDKHYAIKTYPDDIDDRLKKFIGVKIDWDESKED